tara:strand:+ start:4338 stop:4715 length:378 start_codon:yes stop_codon:yes gene_type:complete
MSETPGTSLTHVKVGDKLIVTASKHWQPPYKVVIVSKVGRNWLYVKNYREGMVVSEFSKGDRGFSRKDGRPKVINTGKAHTIEKYEYDQKYASLLKKARGILSSPNPKVSLEDLKSFVSSVEETS